MTGLREALEALADDLESTYPATFVSVGERSAARKFRAVLAAHPEQTEANRDAATEAIVNGWLVAQVNEHTCGTGSNGHYGAHEPGCGTIPLANLKDLDGWTELEAQIKAEALREAARNEYQVSMDCENHCDNATLTRLTVRADNLHPRKDTR